MVHGSREKGVRGPSDQDRVKNRKDVLNRPEVQNVWLISVLRETLPENLKHENPPIPTL